MNTPHDRFADCPHCYAEHSVARPSPLWRVALGAAWLVFGALVVGIGLIGPFILVAGPVVLFSGAAVLGYLHGRAGEDPACSECGKLDRPGAPENSALESLSAAGDMCDAAA